MKEISNGFDENDEFWSLESMLPPAKKNYGKSSFDTSTVQIEISGERSAEGKPIPSKYPPITQSVRRGENGERIDFSTWLAQREKYKKDVALTQNRIIREYVPDQPLIKKVTVSESIGARGIVERFIDQGKRMFSLDAPFTGNVRYDIVYPQYASMDERQKMCYIGFRSEVRAGRYPSVDKAYIYLYLYELINIPELMSGKERAEAVAALICGYPESDDKLFSDMCNWLCDICLIEQIPIPRAIFGEVHPRVLKCARSREVFIERGGDGKDRRMYALMLSCGGYDHRGSRFYPENKLFYDKYIDEAVCYALEKTAQRDSRFRCREEDTCTISHESFFGAYRTVNARKKVTLECVSLTHGDDERRIVSDLTKYAENCLRGYLGIKQKLTVSYINLEKKQFIKEYFFAHDAEMPRRRNIAESEKNIIPVIPEYEKLYDVKSEEASFESASRIEESSWSVTEKLVGAFEDQEENGEEYTDKTDYQSIDTTPSIAPVTAKNSENYILKVIELIKAQNAIGLNELAKNKNVFVGALVDEANEYLLDAIGDIAIENDGDGYKIASWYEDEIDELIRKG